MPTFLVGEGKWESVIHSYILSRIAFASAVNKRLSTSFSWLKLFQQNLLRSLIMIFNISNGALEELRVVPLLGWSRNHARWHQTPEAVPNESGHQWLPSTWQGKWGMEEVRWVGRKKNTELMIWAVMCRAGKQMGRQTRTIRPCNKEAHRGAEAGLWICCQRGLSGYFKIKLRL